MQSQCAVLTTRQAGSLLDSNDWQISEAGDWMSMVDKLTRLVKDPDYSQELAEKNGEVMARYRMTSYGDRMASVYRDVS
jgi:hypothetical protein